MKRSIYKIASYLVFAVILVSFLGAESNNDDKKKWVSPVSKKSMANPLAKFKEKASFLEAGQKVYNDQCATCHGESGNGDGPSAKFLVPLPKDLSLPEVQDQTDGELFWKVSTGNSPMPAFESILNQNQRWLVINYMRTLK